MSSTPRVSRLAFTLALAAAAGCTGPSGTYVTPSELDQRARAGGAATAAGGEGAPSARAVAAANQDRNGLSPEQQAKKDGFEGRTISLHRRAEDRTRSASELDQRRARVQLEQASAIASETLSLQNAEREHRLATEDLKHFIDVELPRRLAENALEMRGSADNLLETREELAQLEMMYSESDLGDATAEIVLSRTRRRLQRAEDGHKLREERSAELKTITLPREQERLAQELSAKTVTLDNVRRAAEVGALARAAALRDLDFEVRKLAREQDDIARDEMLLAAETARWERDVSADNAAGAPAGASGVTP